MDELLKAITELIRTGGNLAQPALIGYFVFQTVSVLVMPVMIWAVSLGAIRITRIIWDGILAETKIKQENENIREDIRERVRLGQRQK